MKVLGQNFGHVLGYLIERTNSCFLEFTWIGAKEIKKNVRGENLASFIDLGQMLDLLMGVLTL